MPNFLKLFSLACAAALFAFAQPAAASGPAGSPVVYILHGYAATPDDHWFPWLRQQLAERGIEAHVLSLPDSSHPSPQAWARYLDQAIARHDRATYFVAHSLGCIALLQHLQRQPEETRVGGAVLVSGFSAPLPGLPQLDAFVSPPPDLAAVARRIKTRRVIAAEDDTIVPYALSARLAEQLDAALSPVAHGGHFLASDGFVQMPPVLSELLAMMGR